jgi:predicted 3-demethylubiquinone-9 3-methyltransferase (glyoxalase superfamily)
MKISEPTNSLLVRLEGLTHKFEQGLERIQEYEKEVDAKKEILIEAIKIRDARIAELEAYINQLIEAGESMSLAVECENQIEANAYYSWKELVREAGRRDSR